ncbi:hypothetical protein GHT06_006670 [Daphnia sinensis]|uniref:Uncharacterized protein n=1 Tax=Daphnia sinensis TaxID=1820382 RepID=A0AAD5KF70_9CRUS|nr:hypothetical protein GHT06_006670 [Daphnia sinensis]
MYLSPGIEGGDEKAEKRVEKELRLAINQGSTENVAVEISSLPNTCSSFHNSTIRAVKTARTGESSDVTTCVTVNIRDYLRKPYLSWLTDPLEYWLTKKKPDVSDPSLMLLTFFFVFLPHPYHPSSFFVLRGRHEVGQTGKAGSFSPRMTCPTSWTATLLRSDTWL